MMTVQLKPLDAAKRLSTDENQADILSDAFATDDPAYIANALGVVARAKGMSQVSRNAGVTRETLYKALSPSGDPKLSMLLEVMRAPGVSLSASTVHPAE